MAAMIIAVLLLFAARAFVPNHLQLISDHAGTIHALVAAMTNSVLLAEPIIVETRTYSPYGELIEVDCLLPTANCQQPTAHCPFGFQSKYYDPETGFWYYGFRYYDAKTCKWLTADPLGEAGGLNLTAFCGGDPINQVDALGLSVWGDLGDDVDRLYRENRPITAFLYDFSVRAWNGFSFGMLNRQSGQEDALADGEISLGRYAAGASVNMAISGAQLALTVGGAGRVATSAKGAASLMGAVAQGARVGGEIALLGGVAEQFGTHLSDTLAGISHERTLRQEAANVLVQTGKGVALGAALSGLSYGGLKVIASLHASRSGQMVRAGERVTVQKGHFVNRVFDSRAGQASANVSGPLGRSFSPGSGVPTTASEAIQQRGLNIFYPNNAQEAIIMRARVNIPAIQRTSIGGTKPELLIEPQYWNQLEAIRQFSLPAGTP